MKLLQILLFAALPLLAAAAPAVVVDSAGNVTVDGVAYGQPVDAMKNNPALASDIQRALLAWQTRKDAEHQAAIAAAQKASDDAIAANAAELESLQRQIATLTAQVGQRDATIAAAGAHISKLQAQVRRLGAEPVLP